MVGSRDGIWRRCACSTRILGVSGPRSLELRLGMSGYYGRLVMRRVKICEEVPNSEGCESSGVSWTLHSVVLVRKLRLSECVIGKEKEDCNRRYLSDVYARQDCFPR